MSPLITLITSATRGGESGIQGKNLISSLSMVGLGEIVQVSVGGIGDFVNVGTLVAEG